MSYYSEHLATYKKTILAPDYLMQKIITGKHFIDNHSDGRISLKEISQASLISKFHFIRLFKRTYGKTPNQYLVEKRIAKAKALLKDGHEVSGVCFAVGFTSITSFTSLYKKMTGSTPAHFRKRSAKKAISDK